MAESSIGSPRAVLSIDLHEIDTVVPQEFGGDG